MPGMLNEIAIAIGINRSGRLSVRKAKILGTNAIKLSTKPATKAGSPIVILKSIVAPNCKKMAGTRKIAPNRSNAGTRGFRNITDNPINIDSVTSGNPTKAAKFGIPINNVKPKKSTKGMMKIRGRLRIK